VFCNDLNMARTVNAKAKAMVVKHNQGRGHKVKVEAKKLVVVTKITENTFRLGKAGTIIICCK